MWSDLTHAMRACCAKREAGVGENGVWLCAEAYQSGELQEVIEKVASE